MKDGTNTDMLRGSCKQAFDPEISEWETTTRNGVVSISEFIGYEKADPGN